MQHNKFYFLLQTCKRFNKLVLLFVCFQLGLINSGCKKMIEIKAPVTSINAQNVFASDATAEAVLTGIYTAIAQSNFTDPGLISVSLFTGLSSDELSIFQGATNSQLTSYYRNALTSSNVGKDFWKTIYPIIFISNSAIEGLSNSNTLTPAVKTVLLGEAKFIRAFCYFQLVNLYGGLPLVTSTDYKINSVLPRVNANQIYDQIIKDLKDAQNLLSTDYLSAQLNTTTEKVRPNKWAATALLARAYLYTKRYSEAENESTLIINSGKFQLESLSNAFLANNNEAIWQIQPVTNNPSNTWEGWMFKLPSGGPNANQYPVYLSKNVVEAFENGDLRKTTWVDSVTSNAKTYYYANKYKVGAGNNSVVEYSTVFRLAEQYLIRAEARAQQNKLAESISDLDIIRDRAGLSLIANTNPGITQTALLDKILHERQVELFTEGHRWFDLKRSSVVDAIMSIATPQKGGTWNTNWQLYPISANELIYDPNLIQNSGY